MNKTNYISIRSILFDLSMLIDDRYWNDLKMYEFAVKGYRSLRIEDKFVQKRFYAKIESHKVQLPEDFKYLVVAATKTDKQALKAMVPASSLLTSDKCLINVCSNCKSEYNIDENLVMTTTKDSGEVYLEYLAYPTNEDGEFLMVDDETVKEAVLNYVLWKYWLGKSLMKEEGAANRATEYRQLYTVYAAKAMSFSLPDVGSMENIKNRWNHILGNQNLFGSLFTNLNEQEYGSF